ncbi:MAG: hydroxyacid dehydrogenase [Thermofilaceae archaeon]|nr:hydroxyacid dehydrogenase [Thermofilaceae archaeon]MCX8180310.1 hydroxyacid dehydrogenase [Thermofilaceae archaeon]MDW8003845.1 hydroxyacid dehydrogenase [Thermofilaceae archaeon]
MPKLVIASASYGVHTPEALQLLSQVFDEIRRVDLKVGEAEDSTARKIGDADALILGAGGTVTRKVMLDASNLKIIARHGIGLDNVDLRAASELGIPVTYCRHTGEEVSVAEHTVALILACARRLVEADKAVREERWGLRASLIGLELRGKTLGIIGFGAIGREVARIMREGFRMRVIAYDPYVPDAVFTEHKVGRVDLEYLLRESDVITIHVPLTSETRRLLNKERIQMIKKGAVLVNTARGAVVDEEELSKALTEGRIFYAGLDVFEQEPPAGSPLPKLPNVVLTPHVAAFTREALYRMDIANAEDLALFFRGERPRHLANPEVYEMGLRAKQVRK